MLISGPRLRLRPVALSDMLLFAACYGDWPPDALGYYSLQRAQSDCDVAVRDNRAVTATLDDASCWQQTLAIYTDDAPGGIGINRARADGKVVTVLNQAFVPEWRGKGLMDELQILLQRYAFDVLGADEARFAIIDSSVSAKAHVQNRAKYQLEGDERGQRGALLRTGRITKEARAAWLQANPKERDSTWNFSP